MVQKTCDHCGSVMDLGAETKIPKIAFSIVKDSKTGWHFVAEVKTHLVKPVETNDLCETCMMRAFFKAVQVRAKLLGVDNG